jgi:heme-degrading monooxygenase HmoA
VEATVHAVIRHYKGNAQLFDELEKRTEDVEKLIRGVSGFVSYVLVRTADGGFSVSVFEDSAGTEESTRVAGEWIRENLPQSVVSRPEVTEGGVILHLNT